MKKSSPTINALATNAPPKPRVKTKVPKVVATPKTQIVPKQLASPSVFKCGGEVKKTGMALVHKGEKVLTKKQQGKR